MTSIPTSSGGPLRSGDFPRRRGSAPRTSTGPPHQQLDQQPADLAIRDRLAERVFALPDVEERASGISVPGARALWLRSASSEHPTGAFLVGREFAHLHPLPDLSLHLTLPTPTAQAAVETGWAEWHPWVTEGRLPETVVMVYAPRDADELEVVTQLVFASYDFARG